MAGRPIEDMTPDEVLDRVWAQLRVAWRVRDEWREYYGWYRARPEARPYIDQRGSLEWANSLVRANERFVARLEDEAWKREHDPS